MKKTMIGKGHIRWALRSLCFGVLLILATEFASGQGATVQVKADDFELATLLGESVRKSDQNWLAMSTRYTDYTFKWRRVVRKKDWKGNLNEESELYEVLVPTVRCWTIKCRWAVVLLERDGKPVPPERIEKERLKVGMKMEKEEREGKDSATLPGNSPKGLNWMRFYVQFKEVTGRDLYLLLDGQEILDKCDFSTPRREQVGGREMIALDFRPRPGTAFSKRTEYMPKVEGRIWIDAADKVFVRLAAWPLGRKFEDASSDVLLREAALAYDLVRTKEGLWLFRFGRINGVGYPELFPKLRTDFSIEQFDYVNFRVEVDKGQVVAPGKQP